MELTKAQIRQLRSMCNTLSPTVSIGKAGVEAVVSAANENLESHDAADALAELTGAQVVQVIGHKFSIYRKTSRKGVKSIELK